MKNLKLSNEDQGKCIGLVNGKVVIKSESITEVMNTLINNYPNEQVSLTSIPKENKIFIL